MSMVCGFCATMEFSQARAKLCGFVQREALAGTRGRASDEKRYVNGA